MINIKRIGYWRRYKEEDDGLPWPEEGNLPLETKQKIVEYLDSGKRHAVWRGWSTCRICGKINGSACLVNDNFEYPEGYSHYIIDHNIMPDIDLLTTVLMKNGFKS